MTAGESPMILEPPPARLPRLGEVVRALDRHSVSNGVAAFLVASTGPLVILLAVSVKGGCRTRTSARGSSPATA
jgi:hypothetical protein